MIRALGRRKLEIALSAPLFAYILGLTGLPLLYALGLSLRDPRTGAFPTISNYLFIASHSQFIQALMNSLAIVVLGVALELIVGLALALSLSQALRGRAIFRSLLLTPLGIPTIVSGVIFTYFFDTSGYLNEALSRLGLIAHPIDWAGGGLKTILMVVVADMWKVTPVVVLILLAGLESIPRSLYKAASTDGAGPLKRFWHITLPLIKPFITMAVILRTIDTFRIFEVPLILAGKATPVLATYSYYEFHDYNNPYSSAAAATILTAIIALFVSGYLALAGRGETSLE
ncbi:MAG: carbohydrate ABC transporter permease [Nitrospinota bacterium]